MKSPPAVISQRHRAALFEQSRRLRSDKHGAFVLPHQPRQGLLFGLAQPFPLALEMQFLHLRRRLGRQMTSGGPP